MMFTNNSPVKCNDLIIDEHNMLTKAIAKAGSSKQDTLWLM